MMNARYLSQSCDVGPLVIRALSSLTQDHADQIAAAVQAGAPDWELDRLEDYDGYLSVLVSPQKAPESQLSYLISGTVQQIELSEVRDDLLRSLGRFDALQQATNALLMLLTSGSHQSAWVSGC